MASKAYLEHVAFWVKDIHLDIKFFMTCWA